MNIDQKLRDKLHELMHHKLGVTCVFNDTRYILCCITRQYNPPISKFTRLCNEFM